MDGRPHLQNAADCHVHVFANAAAPAAPQRANGARRPYAAPDADVGTLARTHLAPLGLDRVVLVQPSIYRDDNTVLTDAIAALPAGSARGVAVISGDEPDDALARLHAAGVRGVRFNMMSGGGPDAGRVADIAARAAGLGWHLQFHLDASALTALEPVLAALPVDAVLDHFARLGPETREGEAALMRLVDGGRCWVKLSGPYRVPGVGADFAAMTPLTHRLIARAPERLVWGSDWPHVPSDPEAVHGDAGRALDCLWSAFDGDVERYVGIMVKNAEALYGFGRN